MSPRSSQLQPQSADCDAGFNPIGESGPQFATSVKGSFRSLKATKNKRPKIKAFSQLHPRRRLKSMGPALGEVVVATLAGLNDYGEPLVRCPLERSGRILVARSTIPLEASHVDREIVLTFECGNIEKPIVIGLLWRPAIVPTNETSTPPPAEPRPDVKASMDGDRVFLTAEREIVLRCGRASLTLTRAGKVLIQGTYLLSRSSGVNRLKGGSVQIN